MGDPLDRMAYQATTAINDLRARAVELAQQKAALVAVAKDLADVFACGSDFHFSATAARSYWLALESALIMAGVPRPYDIAASK